MKSILKEAITDLHISPMTMASLMLDSQATEICLHTVTSQQTAGPLLAYADPAFYANS